MILEWKWLKFSCLLFIARDSYFIIGKHRYFYKTGAEAGPASLLLFMSSTSLQAATSGVFLMEETGHHLLLCKAEKGACPSPPDQYGAVQLESEYVRGNVLLSRNLISLVDWWQVKVDFILVPHPSSSFVDCNPPTVATRGVKSCFM